MTFIGKTIGTGKFVGKLLTGSIPTGTPIEWNPLQLGAKLLSWWSADRADLMTVVSDKVSSLRDVMYGNELVQGTAGNRPGYAATGFDGDPCFTFDKDLSQYLSAASVFNLPVGATPSNQWAVTQQDAPNSDISTVRVLFSYGAATSSTRIGLQRSFTTGYDRAAFTGGTGAASVTPRNDAVEFKGRHWLRGRNTGVTLEAFVDGVPSGGPVACVTAIGATKTALGCISNTTPSSFYTGKIRDVLITTDTLTASETAALSRWLDKQAHITSTISKLCVISLDSSI